MKKKLKQFIVLNLLLLIFPLAAKAENVTISPGGKITGNDSATLGCASSSLYCYSGAGIRFSLYYYDNGKATKVGSSHDVWSSKLDYPGKNNSWSSYLYYYSSLDNNNDSINNRVNEKAVNNGTKWGVKCSGAKITLKNKYNTFNKNYSYYTSMRKKGLVETTSDFGDYTDKDTDAFIAWIPTYLQSKMKKVTNVNKFFATTINGGDVKKYYITVEPIFRIWINKKQINNMDNYKNHGYNHGYIGTVYELSKIYHYDRYTVALKTTSNDKNEFVGKVLKSAKKTIYDWKGCDILDKEAGGVSVYKLSAYTEPSCACDEDDYKCAMKYCDANASESNRKTCVTKTCGVKDPGFSTCGQDSSTAGKTTSCASSTSASNTTCTKGNADTYYKTICTETSNIYYNDSLPTSLKPGTGFSYSLLLSGSKTCDTAFDVNKWNFDYAVSTDSNRKKLITKLTNYQNLSSADLSKYQYNSGDANITIDIKEKVENQKKSKNVTKKLQKFVDVIKKDIKVSNRDNTFKVMTEKTKYNNKTFTSSMSSIYALQNTCIDGASGEVYDAKYDDLTKKYICNNTNDGPYNKYFTNLKAQVDTINGTTVKITKTSSNMDGLINTCHYKVEDQPLNCVILKNNNTYSLKLYSENNIDYQTLKYSEMQLQYILSTNPNDDNWSQSITKPETGILTKINKSNSTKFTLYGKIRTIDRNGEFKTIATCSISQPEKNTGDSCTTKYKPTKYEEISEYCKNNWYTDKNNYTNEKACYNACTNTADSCKIKYTCNDTTSIQQYCNSQYNKITQATLYRSCINDCSCGGGDAVYRPISLTNPFPNNRQAGANWQGYEDIIKETTQNDKTPEYVIELSASDIEDINAQTEHYNTSTKNAYIDYVRASGSDKNGKYKSKFIHETNKDLFCIIDGEGDCK